MVRINSLRQVIKSFGSDRRGNVLIMFGFALVPMLGLTGAAIDYSRASTARRLLASALDSAALMAARDASKLTDDQLRARINDFIRANLHGDAAAAFTSATSTIDRTARTVSIAANLDIATSLARVIGKDKINVDTTSQAAWGTNTIELALALDNTGSMSSSGKMTALKTASLDLLKIMKEAATEPDQIKISIVPFNTQVRLSTSYKDAEWLRWDETKTTCSGWGWSQTCTTTTISKSTWKGCITDRDQPYDTQDGGSLVANDTLYPADFCDQTTLTEVRPLTNDWTALTNTINAMTPVGNTNVTIGAIWGMATLSQAQPFIEAKAPTTPRLKKFMILLTDGQNTENRFSTNQAAIDARTTLACNSVKATGVTLYTIRVIDGNATLLKSCATDPSKYFNVTAASQLSPIFKQIASEISAVRLTM